MISTVWDGKSCAMAGPASISDTPASRIADNLFIFLLGTARSSSELSISPSVIDTNQHLVNYLKLKRFERIGGYHASDTKAI